MLLLEISYAIDDLDAVAKSLLAKVTSKTLLFYGDMGMGKTTLIKAIAKCLGSEQSGHSPTFSIVNDYELNNDLIYHLDLYRIKDEEEAFDFGIEEYLFSGHWIFVEWPEKLGKLTPQFYNRIHIEINPNGSRTLKLTTPDNLNKEEAKM